LENGINLLLLFIKLYILSREINKNIILYQIEAKCLWNRL